MSFSTASPSRSGLGCGRLVLIVLVAAMIYSGIRYFIDQSGYNQGHAFYQRSDCISAIPAFDSVIDGWRLADFGDYVAFAVAERAECRSLQVGVDKQLAGDWGGSLLAYNDFVTNHPASPLIESARNKTITLFSQSDSMVLASQGVCAQIDAFLGNDLIPQRDTNLPRLYNSCGQVYESNNDYANAVTLYERFLSEYKNHSLAPQVEASLARSIIADAKKTGAGTIPAPQRSGSTTAGSSVVVIQNDSPERMQIVFSGPEVRIEELAACNSCPIFRGTGPASCPEKGPIGHYTLKPGQYDVVVKSISDTSTTPWSGDWSVSSGDE